MESEQWLPDHEMNNDDIIDISKHAGERPQASPLCEELQDTKECREWEEKDSAGESTSIGYVVPNGQPRRHTYKECYTDIVRYI